jgi:hypothetical protein
LLELTEATALSGKQVPWSPGLIPSFSSVYFVLKFSFLFESRLLQSSIIDYNRMKLLTVLSFVWAMTFGAAKHSPNTHCNVYDLLEDCKETVVDVADDGGTISVGELDNYLIEECQEMSGLLVAKCLMKYLCINHGEAAVDKVRDCVLDVCPLARRLPPKVCHNRNLLEIEQAFLRGR